VSVPSIVFPRVVHDYLDKQITRELTAKIIIAAPAARLTASFSWLPTTWLKMLFAASPGDRARSLRSAWLANDKAVSSSCCDTFRASRRCDRMRRCAMSVLADTVEKVAG
jgi:hypothetical protein